MVEFDSPWKDALDEYFPAFMEFFFPAAHVEIDWSRGYELLDTELQQIVREAELGSRRVDRLFKVWRTDGVEAWILIHVEIQSQQDSEFPWRMFVYHYRIFDRFNRDVVSLAILGDTNPSWRPHRFEYNNWGCEMRFTYPVIKLLDYADRLDYLETHENPFATVVLAHLKSQDTRGDAQSRRAWKIRLVRGLYDRGYDARKVRRLFTFIDWVLDLPKPLELEFWNVIKSLEQEKNMPFMTTPERIGFQQGHLEGLLEGTESLLDIKFGAEGLPLLPEIRKAEDVTRLRAIAQAIKTASSVSELRQLIAATS